MSKKEPPLSDENSERIVPLRNILQIAILVEATGEKIYTNLAKNSDSKENTEFFLKLAADEQRHKKFFEDILSRWIPREITLGTVKFLDNKLKEFGIFQDMPSPGSKTEEIVKYMIKQEKRMAEYYRSFEETFSEVWKKEKILELAGEELDHVSTLRAR